MFWQRWRSVQETTARKAKRACALIVLCVGTTQVDSVDITELQVFENSGVYHINVVTVIDAPAEYVHKVLTDYVHIYRLNPSITESQILPSTGNGAVRVRIRILDCIFIFCMELDWVEDVYELPPYDLRTIIVPSLSNFQSGKTDWVIEPEGEHSQVIYEAKLEPDFVILPIIGPFLIKEKLRKKMVVSMARIECFAKIQEELDWSPHLQVASVEIDTLCGEKCDADTGQCPQ
ncbi:MAG: SRPBCC family protein [Pseudomonadota bacterium]